MIRRIIRRLKAENEEKEENDTYLVKPPKMWNEWIWIPEYKGYPPRVVGVGS